MPHKPAKQVILGPLSHETVSSWLKNINTLNTRSAYRTDLIDFIEFFKIRSIDEFKKINRANVIDWRDYLKGTPEKPGLAIRTVKRRMSTISKFFEYLCDENVLETNTIIGVERPKLQANEGATGAINIFQARDLLNAPDIKTLQGKRDKAILATFLFHALRRSEVSHLKIKDIEERQGIKQFKVHGKGDKIRYVSLSHQAIPIILDYLDYAGHKNELESPLFLSLSNNSKNKRTYMTPISIYNIVVFYGKKAGINMTKFSPHSLRSTAATTALENGEDLRKVQDWLGHANISTTAMYDKRKTKPEDSPSFRVRY